jgi:hypothetical protein
VQVPADIELRKAPGKAGAISRCKSGPGRVPRSNDFGRWVPGREINAALSDRKIKARPALTTELLDNHHLQVIVTFGGSPPAIAVKSRTATIPIVFVTGNPVTLGLVSSLNRPTCVCRKLRFGRIGDEVRRPAHVTQCVRPAERRARLVHPCPMSSAFSKCCNNYSRKILGLGANAARPMRRHGRRTRDGSFRSAVPRRRSATASPVQWACRGYPWLVIDA